MTWEKCQSVLKLLHGDKCGSHHRHMGSLDKDDSLGKFGGSASELRGVLPTALLAEKRTGPGSTLSYLSLLPHSALRCSDANKPVSSYKVRTKSVCTHSLSHVRLFATPWTVAPSSARGIFQARILKWVAISSSRRSSQPRDQTHIPCIGRWVLYHWVTLEAQ